jgi:cupin fold WbuC family metalloprotein
MKKIFSKVEQSLLLHTIYRFEDITENRTDISPEEEFLQVSTFRLKSGKTFRAHQHIEHIKQTNRTQESWVVIKGSVKVLLYDIDDKLISEEILKRGDCTVTFRGGHNYLCLEDDTVIYEYKTGPYQGQKLDKEFINV